MDPSFLAHAKGTILERLWEGRDGRPMVCFTTEFADHETEGETVSADLTQAWCDIYRDAFKDLQRESEIEIVSSSIVPRDAIRDYMFKVRLPRQ